MSIATMDWHVRALTDMWTGDATGQGQRTITTGLLGSLRWWFEVLVRGLGGAACDPSVDGNRCPTNEGQRCLVCELFGCTGRARKFRFDVRDSSGAIMSNQIKRNTTFVLRFTPLRPNAVEEWTLLDLTIRLIAEYGAIGGRTVLKPSDEANRHNLSHHRDYGIIRVEQRPKTARVPLTDLERYACLDRWRRPREEGFIWAGPQSQHVQQGDPAAGTEKPGGEW